LSSQPAVTAHLLKPLESLSKEDLIQQHKLLQQSLATKQSPAVKLQIQKIHAELAKQHRQEQAPRLGAGHVSVVGTTPGASTTVPSVTQVNGITVTTTAQQSMQHRPPPLMPVDQVPQIKEIQDPKAAPPQPSDPLDFVTLSYKTLVRVDDAGNVNDEVVTHESTFMLHNTFEGFVGKRVGNGPSKDMYDEGSRKRSRRELNDNVVVDMLLCNAEGHSDPYMASFVNWAQEV
jgi:hypothetical protein